MASTRISAPMRGVTHQLRSLSIRPNAPCARCAKSLCTPTRRSISTSAPSKATLSSINTNTHASGYVPVKPFEEQTVLATIHQFPSLEPLRFQQYPANHLYLPTRRDILHRAIVYEGDSTRLGTASTKTRYEIRGSARKIRPQKGSGRARLGDKKSPMLKGGGVAHGPKPRDFATDLPKKVYDLAWRTALSYRFRKGELIIVDNAMEIESPSAKLLGDILKYHEKLHGRGRSLMVTLEERPLLEQALVEMDRGEQTLTWEEVDVKNLLELSRVIIERDALQNILLSHEEDITHKAITPWHKSLVRSLPPTELESTIGWEEFRELSLSDPKEKDAIRAGIYENVAGTRYTYAESLPQGPKRSELTVSAYNLLAEAKELQFAEKTGRSFNDYLVSQETGEWPRIQTLTYQINTKYELASRALNTNRLESEEIMVELGELQVRKAEVEYEAALLAAQIHEHRSEALRLSGDAVKAEEQLELASGERSNVDSAELALLEARFELGKQKNVVATLKGHFAEQKKITEEVRRCEEQVETKKAEMAAETAELDESIGSEEVQEVDVATGAETKAEPAKKEKRL